jgi:hypothetical protein
MTNRYYRVRPIAKPDVNGLVVKLKDGKLECMTGNENDLTKYECGLEKKNNFCVGKNYFYGEIKKSRAYELRRKAANWGLMAAWVNEGFPQPSSHLTFGPGGDSLL